jgi:xanthine dehydrogenase small subunit
LKLLINGDLVELDPPADETLLNTVRNLGLKGTKEGCASGDCGACTVLIGERTDDDVNYRIVNACIAPTGQYEGMHVVTVEGLASVSVPPTVDGPAKELHPAQEEMIRYHGSQCGYCTPGFVMSLAALVEQGAPADRKTVLEGISGNLCRCTGYRPIVEAGIAALQSQHTTLLAMPSAFDALAQSAGSAMARPRSEAELQAELSRDANRPLIAGGTDYMLEVTQRFASVPFMIDVSAIPSLKMITEADDCVVFGAALPYSVLEAWAHDVSKPLHDLLLRLGSRQIRNSGTIGGNLANGSPIADMPPILIAWDAQIELVNSMGETRRVAVEDFYEGYRQTKLVQGEYVARIHVPKTALGQFHRFYKSSKRIEDDISSVMGAFRFELKDNRVSEARVAYGGMAATPVRLKAIESALIDKEITPTLIKSVANQIRKEMTPMSDVRASAGYREDMAAVMLERALHASLGNDLSLVTEVNLDA